MKIVIYDFDGTLTPYPITKLSILEKCGYIGGGNNLKFKELVNIKMIKKNISVYESFYENIFEVIKNNNYKLTDNILSIGASELEYNDGVKEFLSYLNKHNVKNYIISSGMKTFIKNTNINKYIKDIYATTFKYKNNEIIGLENLITDTKKIECIKDIIIKNNIKDFSNIIYIGDGLTDLPIMEYIKKNGGITIYVGDEDKVINKTFITHFCKKEYSKTSGIYKIISDKFNI